MSPLTSAELPQAAPDGAGAGGETPPDHIIVLFGATGDLAGRKLLPGLYHLDEVGLMPQRWRIIGVSGDEYDADGFRNHAREEVERFGQFERGPEVWEKFAETLDYVPQSAGPAAIGEAVRKAAKALGGEPRLLHYLAVPPAAFDDIIGELGQLDLTGPSSRVVIEKPFGYDLASAEKLNALLRSEFEEDQIFRIDHFLGKEAVQNVLALRFANGLYEPIWNRHNVEYVQIDVPEQLSIEDRAGFYESTGAYRDMIVTHLLQLLSFIAMEPPAKLTAESLAAEKQKVFEAIKPIQPEDVVRGQYEGYRESDGVDPDSDVETFVAVKVEIDSWRWSGVPFYLRTGKALAESHHMVVLDFEEPPMMMFPGEVQHQGANQLVFEISEPGSITVDFQAKRPGAEMTLGPARMIFDYDQSFSSENQLEAYERLIHDAMLGERTLFTRSRGIERLWAVSAPVLEHPTPVVPYAQGSWGPEEAQELIAPGRWRLPDDEDQ